jgi:hypothetical protein
MLLKVGVAMVAVEFAAAVAVAAAFLFAAPAELSTTVRSTRKPAVEPLTRSDPGVDPCVENIPAPRLEPEPVAVPQPRSNPQPKPDLQPKPDPRPQPEPTAPIRTETEGGTRSTP